MEIRPYEDHAELRSALEARDRAWRVGYRGMVPERVIEAQLREPDDADLAVLDEELAAEPGNLLVATVEGTVVGYVRARYGETPDYVSAIGGELAELYVDPARWREGVGSALIGGAVDWLPEMIDGISTRVLAENERARSFLEANDLVLEERTTVDLAGEPFEHVVYRVGFED